MPCYRVWQQEEKIKEFEACIEKWRSQPALDFGCGKGVHYKCLGAFQIFMVMIPVLDFNTLSHKNLILCFVTMSEHVESLYR